MTRLARDGDETTRRDDCTSRFHGNDYDACPCDDESCGTCRERARRALAEREAYEALQPMFDAVAFKLLRGQVTVEQVAERLGTSVPQRRS